MLPYKERLSLLQRTRYNDLEVQRCVTPIPAFLPQTNPTKFVGNITAEQLRQARACGNHTSVANNVPKVEHALNKEDCKKHVEVFPCWLERFFPDTCTAPHGLICKEVKSDRLVLDGSFLETPFSTYINQFASTMDKIELHYGTEMTRHLVQTHDLRTSCPSKDILLFDDEASGVFRHVTLHPYVAASHACSVGQKLCTPIGSVFVANVRPRNWEAFA